MNAQDDDDLEAEAEAEYQRHQEQMLLEQQQGGGVRADTTSASTVSIPGLSVAEQAKLEAARLAREYRQQQAQQQAQQQVQQHGVESSSSSAETPNFSDAAKIAREKALEIAARLGGVLGKHKRDDGAEPSSKRKKIPIPVHEDPSFNFLGLLLGPRGETQKQMEADSGARILVRGRGASKDGNDEDADEDMYVLVSADTDDALDRGVRIVESLLNDPDRRNAVKQSQLRKVAELNGNEPPRNLPSSLYAPEVLQNPLDASAFFNQRPSGDASGGTTREVRIPNDKVGLVIGKSGETIKMLQAASGAHIQVAKEPGPDGMRVVTITGSDIQLANAERDINRIAAGERVANIRDAAMSSLGGGVVTVNIPNDMVGLLIGKSGESIRQLQARTGANIQVQRDADVLPGAKFRVVTLSGSSQQIQFAQNEIQQMIQGHEMMRSGGGGGGAVGGGSGGGGGSNGGGGGGGGGGSSVSVTTTGSGGVISTILKIPNSTVGIVIGRQGESIKALQAKSGARIQISKDISGPEREVTLSGTPQSVESAKQEIHTLIAQSRGQPPGSVPPPNYGGQGGNGAGGYGTTYGAGAGSYNYGGYGAAAGTYGQAPAGGYPYGGGYPPGYGYYGQGQGQGDSKDKDGQSAGAQQGYDYNQSQQYPGYDYNAYYAQYGQGQYPPQGYEYYQQQGQAGPDQGSQDSGK